MPISRLAFTALAAVLVAAALTSCGGGESQGSSTTVIETVTYEPSIEESPSPSPSFTTAEEYGAAVRETVPRFSDWEDETILETGIEVREMYYERGATRDEVMTYLQDEDSLGVAADALTSFEANQFFALTLGACELFD